MAIFKGQNLLEFAERFKTDLDCKAYLGQIKWKDSFVCRKCGNAS
ncbi:transposase, partial [Tenacibaculum maritimum]